MRPSSLRTMIAATAVLVGVAAIGPAAGSARPHAARPFDVNCDGRPDLVVSELYAPNLRTKTGRIHVALGSAHGLVHGFALTGRAKSLTSGDFDRDGCADLAVWAPDARSGRVHARVLYGDHNRPLRTSRNTELPLGYQQSPADLIGQREPAPYRADALAVGDFNGDGFADLALGLPAAGAAAGPFVTSPVMTAGAVQVRYGGPTGLYAGTEPGRAQYERWDEQSAHVPGPTGNNDAFGESLAPGDVNGDHRDDLVIGIPGKTVGDIEQAGAATELFGSSAGLTAEGNSSFNLDTPGVRGQAEQQSVCETDGEGEGPDACFNSGEYFGAAISLGDIDGDGYDDAALGIPDKEVLPRHYDGSGWHPPDYDGAVSVLFGAAHGLTSRSQFFTLNSPGVPGQITGKTDEAVGFGARVAVADFDNDGRADVAAAAPSLQLRTLSDAGAVVVLRGGGSGVTTRGAKLLVGSFTSRTAAEWFGFSLVATDVTGDRTPDLLVGAPESGADGKSGAGLAFLYRGRSGGLSVDHAQRLQARSALFRGSGAEGTQFGYVGPESG